MEWPNAWRDNPLLCCSTYCAIASPAPVGKSAALHSGLQLRTCCQQNQRVQAQAILHLLQQVPSSSEASRLRPLAGSESQQLSSLVPPATATSSLE